MAKHPLSSRGGRMLLGEGHDHDGSTSIPKRLPEAAMSCTPRARPRVVSLSRMYEDSPVGIQLRSAACATSSADCRPPFPNAGVSLRRLRLRRHGAPRRGRLTPTLHPAKTSCSAARITELSGSWPVQRRKLMTPWLTSMPRPSRTVQPRAAASCSRRV